MPKSGITPVLLSAKDAARYLGVSHSHFYDSIRPFLPVVDLARPESRRGLWRWHIDDLDEWIAKRRRDRGI